MIRQYLIEHLVERAPTNPLALLALGGTLGSSVATGSMYWLIGPAMAIFWSLSGWGRKRAPNAAKQRIT